MSFKMKCPKCESQSYSVERDTRTYTTGKSGELVFSCRCGKQLFGDQLTAEYDRQKTLWEADPARRAAAMDRESRQREEEARQEALRQAFEYRRAWVAQKRLGIAQPTLAQPAPAQAAQQQAGPSPRVAPTPTEARTPSRPVANPPSNRAAEPVAQEQVSAAATSSEPLSTVCEWAGCTNIPAPNSKYCSRTCSNKNARLRHARRKKGSQVAA